MPSWLGEPGRRQLVAGARCQRQPVLDVPLGQLQVAGGDLDPGQIVQPEAALELRPAARRTSIHRFMMAARRRQLAVPLLLTPEQHPGPHHQMPVQHVAVQRDRLRHQRVLADTQHQRCRRDGRRRLRQQPAVATPASDRQTLVGHLEALRDPPQMQRQQPAEQTQQPAPQSIVGRLPGVREVGERDPEEALRVGKIHLDPSADHLCPERPGWQLGQQPIGEVARGPQVTGGRVLHHLSQDAPYPCLHMLGRGQPRGVGQQFGREPGRPAAGQPFGRRLDRGSDLGVRTEQGTRLVQRPGVVVGGDRRAASRAARGARAR